MSYDIKQRAHEFSFKSIAPQSRYLLFWRFSIRDTKNQLIASNTIDHKKPFEELSDSQLGKALEILIRTKKRQIFNITYTTTSGTHNIKTDDAIKIVNEEQKRRLDENTPPNLDEANLTIDLSRNAKRVYLKA